MKNNIGNFLVICLIFVIVGVWIYSAKPQISFRNFSVPQEPHNVLAQSYVQVAADGDGVDDSANWSNKAGTACNDATPTDCYVEIDETTGSVCDSESDGDDTYVYSDTTISSQTFDVDESSVPDGATVVEIQIYICAIRLSGGAKLQTRYCHNESCSNFGTDISTSASYVAYRQDHSVSFTKTSGSDIEIGLSNTLNGKANKVSMVYAIIGYTTAVASVTIEDGVVAYGIVPVSGTKDTLAVDLNDKQHAGNHGGGTETLEIQGQNSENWTLADTIGSDTYKHEFSTDNGATWRALSTSFVNLDTGLADGQTQDFDLRITLPSSTNYHTVQTVNVTVQATLE